MTAAEAAVTRGIALALAQLARARIVQVGGIEDVLRCAGITSVAELRAAGVVEADVNALRPHLRRARRGKEAGR